MQDESEFFCIIENEQKAFDIVKLYHQRTHTINREYEQVKILHELDNEIQAQEINIHLYLNRVPDYDCTKEQIRWITCYGASFRSYLNTLKILFLTLDAANTDFDTLTFEEFCKIKDRINEHKAFLSIIHG